MESESFCNFAKIFVKSGLEKEEVVKKLEEKFGKLSSEQFDFVDNLTREKAKIPKREWYKSIIIVPIILLILAAFLIYLEFFDQTIYSQNECDSDSIRIRLIGDREFRIRISESLDILMKNDCDSFRFIVENTKAIEEIAKSPIVSRESYATDKTTPIFALPESEGKILGLLFRGACYHASLSEMECYEKKLGFSKNREGGILIERDDLAYKLIDSLAGLNAFLGNSFVVEIDELIDLETPDLEGGGFS